MLTQKRLRSVLRYDPQTGVFMWTRGQRKGKVAGTMHDARGFLKVSIDNRRYLLHRLAWLWMTGLMPRWNVVHVDGNHANNRWCNLREGDRIQPKPYRAPWSEPTGLAGAYQTGEVFTAMIEADGIMLNIGTFPTAEAAITAALGVIQHARARQKNKLTLTCLLKSEPRRALPAIKSSLDLSKWLS